MRFEGEFRVPGEPEKVLEAFDDIERMVRCMPGAAIDGRDPEGVYLGSMLVAFGPKKIRFKGKVKSAIDPAARRGFLDVRGSADMRTAAPAEVHVEYSVRLDADAPTPTTLVSLVSEAEIGGVLADFARTGGAAVTQALMTMFAERLANEFGRAQGSADLEAPGETNALAPKTMPVAPVAQAPAASATLPVGRLFWLIMKGRLLVLSSWLRRKLILRS